VTRRGPSDVLGAGEVERALAGLDWVLQGDEMVKERRGRDFADSLAFVDAVGALAESMDHHPDIEIRWNVVTLHLVTHSAGGITDLDLELAGRIDRLG
jgi:4a-hydroxytetrahydrobiopterin dehydratase